MEHRILATISLLLLLASLSSGATMYLSPDGIVKASSCRDRSCEDRSNPCGPSGPFDVTLDDETCVVVLLGTDWSSTPLSISAPSALLPIGLIQISSETQISGLDLAYASEAADLPVEFSIHSTGTKLVIRVDGDVTFQRSEIFFSRSNSVGLAFSRTGQRLTLVNTMWDHDIPTSSIQWGGPAIAPQLYIESDSEVVVSGKFFDGDLEDAILRSSTITSSGLCKSVQKTLEITQSVISMRGDRFVFDENSSRQTAAPSALNIGDSRIGSAVANSVLLPDSSGGASFFIASSNFTNVAPFRYGLSGLIAQNLNVTANSFKNSPLYLETSATSAVIAKNTFTSPPQGLSALAISRGSPINLVNNIYEPRSCILSLNSATIESLSDETIESICVAGGVTWTGNLYLKKEIVIGPGGDASSLLRFTNAESSLKFDQFTFGVQLDLEQPRVNLVIEDISTPSRATPAGSTTINKLPRELAVYWNRPVAGQYKILTDIVPGVTVSLPIQTSPDWSYSLQLDGSDLVMTVDVTCSSCNTAHAFCDEPNVCTCTGGWTGTTCSTPPAPVSTTPIPPAPNPIPATPPRPDSIPATPPAPTSAPAFTSPPVSPTPSAAPLSSAPVSSPTPTPEAQPTSLPPTQSPLGTSAPISTPNIPFPSAPPALETVPTPVLVGCGVSPGPQFICVNGEWIVNSPVEEPTVAIPSNTGVVVINGDLNVTSAITFSGLNSHLVVNGCVSIHGNVEIQLNEQEIEQLALESGGKGSKSKNLLSQVGNNTCPGATDLTTIPLNLKAPPTCTKLSSQNTSTKSSLSILFTVDNSSCKKSSKIVAIVVPSVLGGLIVLAAVGVAVGLVLKARAEKSNKARLSIGSA